MEPNETAEPIFSCDGCEIQGPHKATDDGRAIMCDGCRDEYNRQMAADNE